MSNICPVSLATVAMPQPEMLRQTSRATSAVVFARVLTSIVFRPYVVHSGGAFLAAGLLDASLIAKEMAMLEPLRSGDAWRNLPTRN